MQFYDTCTQCGTRYHINNTYGCPICNNINLIQIEIIDNEIKKLQERRALLQRAYDAEKAAVNTDKVMQP
jgi:hypothetical protein